MSSRSYHITVTSTYRLLTYGLVISALLTSSRLVAEEKLESLKKVETSDHPESYIGLQKVGNQPVDAQLGNVENNQLGSIEPGIYKSGDVEFLIEKKMIHLGSNVTYQDLPEKVTIPVVRKAGSLHLLHACQNGGFQDPDHPTHVADNTQIGEFVFVYEDDTQAKIPLIYGDHVRDWWNWDGNKPTKKSLVAWEGTNPGSRQYDLNLRLFRTTLKNPHPEKTIKSLIYSSTKKTAAAPFCLAISVGE